MENNMLEYTPRIPTHWKFSKQRKLETPLSDPAPAVLAPKNECKGFDSWLKKQCENTKEIQSLWSVLAASERGADPRAAISSGEVPFGFSDSFVWPKVVKTLQGVTNKMNSGSQRKQELKNRMEELRAELNKCEEEYALITESVQVWEEMKAPCEQATKLAQSCQELEEEFSSVVEQALEEPEDLSADHLILVFNAVGLSRDIIQKITAKRVTGEEFLDPCYSAVYDGITNEERMDVGYCRHMMEVRKIPYLKHDDCVICRCDTEELIYLFEEHEEWKLSPDIAKKKCINGPRFFMMSINELEETFSISRAQARTVWKEKKQIHYAALSPGI
uniref:Uncharacterized protein n=1 Tax=Vannella robusta TaxID=1487602 RepID=A0A7S4INT2_9EUKA|mmetsp:Transcript_5928/g.7303  ORF Transcript_5928/g.7303 Transcript_5928/m.7303 type:complete len:332 (+) Transcript_5928:159-1154(+)